MLHILFTGVKMTIKTSRNVLQILEEEALRIVWKLLSKLIHVI